MVEVGDSDSLRSYIQSLVLKINLNPCSEDAEMLTNYVQTLSHKLHQTGLVTDDLTDSKYFVSFGSLKGGLPSKANEVDGHVPENLCQSGRNASNIVRKELELLSSARDCNRMSKIIIENLSSYPLLYKNAGSYSGFFFSDAKSAFQTVSVVDSVREKYTIAAQKGVGGIMHTKTRDTARGSAGYFSFTVPTKGRNYIVYVGFSCTYNGSNCAGIQIAA